VWKIRRSGSAVAIDRPRIETFGENVGVLTREIFGLEVTHSGFHKLLSTSVDGASNFDDVLLRFRGQLGGEAKAILHAMIANCSDSQLS
jgi:hypothetical protein